MKTLKLLFIVVILGASKLLAQQQFDNPSRSIWLLDIAKYVTWPNEKQIDTFKICILSNDTNLVQHIKIEAQKRKLLHNKPMKILHSNNYTTIPNCNLLFFNKNENYDIDKIYKIVTNPNVLIVTENYEFHKSMINFIVVNNRKSYEVNISKLQENGFTANELFVAGAIKSKADWEVIYKQTDKELQKEKEIVEQQSLQIQQQRQEIEKQQNIIAAQKAEINQQLEQIQKQKQALLNIQQQVLKNATLLKQKIKELEQREKVLQAKNEEINQKSVILANQQKEIDKQNDKINQQKQILNEQLAKIHMQQLIMYLFIAMILLLVFLGFFIYRNYKIKKQANIILSLKNEEILKQNEEIKQQKIEIEKQRDEIALQKQEITDSIKYASRIQQAVLPPLKIIENLFYENFFIFNRPRDIVSGDYYFITSKEKKLIVSAADCTGHGVPGAFMSLLGISFLNEIINKQEQLEADIILNQLRQNIINALNQSGDKNTKDGMDMVLCIFDFEKNIVQFAGANNPLYHIRNGELIEIKGDKMPIGLYDELKPFTKHIIELQPNDTFYMFSDGYADQFGGPDGKKFKYKQLKEMLLSIQHLQMKEQYKVIEETIDNWKKGYFQVDDMLLIGIKYKPI
ncbi:MAG: DUF4154 domain-containing protein [Bacteroidales bacterium]|nr:DUF4154 domain-containing protein [Bacteroidales bacterium]